MRAVGCPTESPRYVSRNPKEHREWEIWMLMPSETRYLLGFEFICPGNRVLLSPPVHRAPVPCCPSLIPLRSSQSPSEHVAKAGECPPAKGVIADPSHRGAAKSVSPVFPRFKPTHIHG
ncbi:hypothetical protein FIBSPDRAFT_101802 [Athelia psychrophila]|uniref:Uncharacterized protein n=1 Tax=Athelia psychrophila TaxID=1759441 RepID=A0A166DGV4_9AGAM|nr:hypothetical protein FIBSPDRAFT_101802 [Fibularhizoctonia sp. CBS 109695]